MKILKYSLSGIICFVIDYSIYSLLIYYTNNIVLANVSARIISSFVNFNINRKIVFDSNSNYYQSLIKYYLLVIFNLIINTTLIKLLSNIISVYISKLIVEIFIYIFNWFIQNKYIFKNKRNK